MAQKIAFQGELGAYSHEACVASRPDHEPLPCATFEDVIAAVKTGAAEFAMLPVENTTYGRVADMHRLLPESGLFINDEVFVRVRINLLALPGVALSDIKVARGHLVILPQCRKFLDAHGIRGEARPITPGLPLILPRAMNAPQQRWPPNWPAAFTAWKLSKKTLKINLITQRAFWSCLRKTGRSGAQVRC